MTSRDSFTIDAKLDLVLERLVDVPHEFVWRAWTEPELLKKWFTPAPWTTVDCEIDLRPGGIFRTVMRSPQGEEYDNAGCYLEIVQNQHLIWTDALAPGFRPSQKPFFTAIISLEGQGKSTKYTAIAKHRDEDGRAQHESMGFHEGWGKALDQLVTLSKKL